jgi:hypothetical protein
MNVLQLQYDPEADRLRAKVRPSSGGETVRVQQGKVVLSINRVQRLIVSFEVEDFRHFVSYHLLDELFGDKVVRELAAFQSEAAAASQRSHKIQVPPLPRSSRRVVDELLRAAAVPSPVSAGHPPSGTYHDQVSNYGWQELPDSLHEYQGRILAGTDVANGSGTCWVKFFEEAEQDKGDMVFFMMPGSQVRALSAYLANVADDADHHYHQEQCGCDKADCAYRHAP